jgi:hypothetical protein
METKSRAERFENVHFSQKGAHINLGPRTMWLLERLRSLKEVKYFLSRQRGDSLKQSI